MFTDRDLSGKTDSTSATITLSGSGATSTSGSGVSIDGGTITITDEGTYVITGSGTDVQVVVAAEDTDKIQLVLDGATIQNSTLPAIRVATADKVFLTMADGTTSTLSVSGTVTDPSDEKADAVVFSHDDLTVNGTGTLKVSAQGGHGIVSKDDLACAGVTLEADTSGACLKANNSVRIASGTYTLTSDDDTIHADSNDTVGGFVYIQDGTFTLDAGDDAVHADGATLVAGGNVDVERSYEGIEGTTVALTGGDVTVVSSDDGINAASSDASGDTSADQVAAGNTSTSSGSGQGGQQGGAMQDFHSNNSANASSGGMMMDTDDSCVITISGGTLTITASGDGIDSNGTVDVTGGTTYVYGPESGGNSSLDYGTGATISGGTFLAAGSTGMAENFTDATQCTGLVTLSGSAGDTITVSDSSGTTIARTTVASSYGCVIVSSPDLTQGSTYTVSNGSTSTQVTFDSTIESSISGGGTNMGGGQTGGNMGGGQAPGQKSSSSAA
jgi:hypothetical protein